MMKYFLLFWKIANMTNGLHSSCLMQDLCKLRYIHTVYVPLHSMANDFQSEVRFAHASDILFVHFEFMFLTYRMSVRHDIYNWVCTFCF